MSAELLNAAINLATGMVLAYAARQLREIRSSSSAIERESRRRRKEIEQQGRDA